MYRIEAVLDIINSKAILKKLQKINKVVRTQKIIKNKKPRLNCVRCGIIMPIYEKGNICAECKVQKLKGKPERKKIPCLKCRKPFNSQHPTNRICPWCKNKPSFQLGLSDELNLTTIQELPD